MKLVCRIIWKSPAQLNFSTSMYYCSGSFLIYNHILMNTRADLALYAHNGQLTVVVEIENKLGTSRKWATHTRRNILAHGGSFNVDYFLIITPDRLYMWKNGGTELARIPPTCEVDMESEFVLYFETAGLDSSHVSSHAFELLVAT